jgi:hypothetical protein
MARTQIRGTRIADGSITKDDLNTDTAGKAVITKIVAGSNVTLDASTGVDDGTGEVTISAELPQGSGNSLYSGAGVPDVGLGANDDYYVDVNTGKIYKKTSSVWNEEVDMATQAEADAVSQQEAAFSIAMAIVFGGR